MPLELLRDLARQALPVTVTSPEDIDKLRVLRAAGHIAVLLPQTDAEGENLFARVLAVTAAGHEALNAGTDAALQAADES